MPVTDPPAHAAAWPDSAHEPVFPGQRQHIHWATILPFLCLHAACLLVFAVGWSPVALVAAAVLYLVRMFGVTAFYHRYFSHRSYRVGRWTQFAGAVLGASAAQRGPLWWAAHHRRHHRHSDTGEDAHSPHAHGVLWSHVGWIAAPANQATDLLQVPDLAVYPELRWLDRNYHVAPLLLLVALLVLGWQLSLHAPQLGTDAVQLAVWGFCISTVVLFHVTSAVNSVGHLVGRRVWPTRDHSRNSWPLALLTLGEGWHNNHHWCPGAARQGIRWWEIDVSYYVLRLLALLGLVHDLRPLPARAQDEHRRLRR